MPSTRSETSRLTFLGLLFGFSVACSEAPEPSYRPRDASQSPPTASSPTGGTQPPTSSTPAGSTTPPTSTPQTPGSQPAQPQVLNEAQATNLIRGSCIYAGCHADATQLMMSANTLNQLQNNLMPPPNQTRYTLRADDRTSLVNFFRTRMGLRGE